VPRAASRARDGLSILIAILTLVLVSAVVLVVSSPLRSARRREQRGSAGAPDSPRVAARSELEAAREAKYREIRDAELDYRTGKLSREDYEAIDGELRAEAIEILDRLESAED
jgi:flagellar biosynthesis/type III secretory pathway M-ring protein FliF/YscJ